MTADIGSKRPHIRQLTGLRAVAAMAVVVLHFQDVFYPLAPATRHAANLVDSGGLGVMVFFVLSGFIISYTYLDRFTTFTRGQYGRFLWARFARMYPVHLTMLLAILVLWIAAKVTGLQLPNPENYRATSFVVNLLMLQGIFPAHPWNAPAWTLTYEAAAYIAFPVLALVLIRLRSARGAYLAGSVTAIAGAGAMIVAYSAVRNQDVGGLVLWMHIAVEFTCGALLYVGWRLDGFRRSLAFDVVGTVATVVAVTMLWTLGGSVRWQLATVPLLALGVLAVAGSRGPVHAVFSSRVMHWLGRISYSLYLVHVTSRSVLRQVVDPEAYTGSSLVVRMGVIALFFLFAIGCAAVLYHLVEEPSRRWLRRWLARRLAPRGTHAMPRQRVPRRQRTAEPGREAGSL